MKSMKFISRLLFMAILFVGVAESGCYAQKKSKKKKKAKEVVEEVVEAVPEVVIDEGPCSKTGPDENESKINVSLYREHYKQKNYADALPYWEYVFANAPGIQKKTFTDGERMFKKFYDEAANDSIPNEELMQQHFDKILAIYAKRVECWGENGYVEGKKGLLYYKYTDDKAKSLELLQNSIDIADTDVSYSIIEPYFSMILKQYKSDVINLDQISDKFDALDNICNFNIENEDNSQKVRDKYTAIWEKISPAKDEIVNAKIFMGMSNCEDAKAFYQPKLAENPNDPNTMKKIRSAMKKFGCASFSNPLYKEATNKLADLDPSPRVLREVANEYLKAEDYVSALSFLDRAIAETSDPSAKASSVLTKANIYWKKGDYPSARKYAEEAAALRPGWGKPYLLIGTLYASSGKKCGPGTGWDSQVVVWAAMDMWSKAKRIDPEVAAKAQKSINKYSAYLPETADGFMRDVKQGDSFKVGCWINRTTTARFQ